MNSILIKIASRCNIKCSYCYWFRDESIKSLPNILTEEAESSFIFKLEQHIRKYQLNAFLVLFHGGEPLLFPKKRFKKLVERILQVGSKNNCKIQFGLTTNGLLLDEDWIAYFKHYEITPALSLDGDKESNDANRVDFLGRGTYDKVVSKIKLLQHHGINPAILTVANTETNPISVLEHFMGLGIDRVNLLIPDFTYNDFDKSLSIANYYKQAFDFWFDEEINPKLNISMFDDIITSFLGGMSGGEMFGKDFELFCLYPDGSIRPHDVLGIINDHKFDNQYPNIINSDLDSITMNTLWKQASMAKKNLPPKCQQCPVKDICSGGYVPHRYSTSNGFNNPSIYCEDLKEIILHIGNKISQTLIINEGA